MTNTPTDDGGRDVADVVIVGGGHAGANAAIALRQRGFAGSIVIVGAEPELPYERPPLTKDYLSGSKTFERMLIRPPEFWAERDVQLILGEPVHTVDPVRQVVAAGREIGYRTLIWATGGSPRPLPCAGADADNVVAIRRRADVDHLLARLGTSQHVCVVGGGYIGLETAAVLNQLGKHVTVLEAADRVLARVAGNDLADFFTAEHRRRGVEIRTATTVAAFETTGNTATAVVTDAGERLATDLVIVGIGIRPETAPLTTAGAAGDDGVDVDEFCRTSLPHVYAIGDGARHANRFADGLRLRIESVQNAADQAKTAAASIVGEPTPYRALPWFWSDQYDLKLKTAGLNIGHDATVVRGDPTARQFSVLYLRDGRLIAADCVNAIKDFTQCRTLLERGGEVVVDRLGDVSVPLKELHAPAAV